MSTSHSPQTTEPVDLTDYEDYAFTGNSGTVLNKRRFIEGLRLKASVYHAAQYAGVGRTTVYRWLDQDSAFATAVADATEDAGDKMETSVYERAFSDNLLAMFWLKAHRHKFRDKVTIDVEAVRNEIEERMRGLGVGAGEVETLLQISPPCDNQQKGEDGQPAPLSSSTTTTEND